MTKRTIVLMLITIMSLLVIIIVSRNRSPFGKNNTSFAVGTDNEITKVELREGKRELYLEKKGVRWILNGENETRKNSILFILRILKEMEIKSPVSEEAFNSTIKTRGIEPVKVKIFENRKLLRSFLVYKTGSNIYGNIMKMNEKAKPFIVFVPGIDVNIGSAFIVNELFWRPYTIFNLLPSEILSVEVENVSDTSSSFLITANNRNFILSDRNKQLAGWDSTRLTRYLSYFIHIPFESWAFDVSPEERRIVESGPPLYRINVTSSRGETTMLTLWKKQTEAGKTDTDRLYGKTNAADELFIVRYFDIDPLLKKRQYFF